MKKLFNKVLFGFIILGTTSLTCLSAFGAQKPIESEIRKVVENCIFTIDIDNNNSSLLCVQIKVLVSGKLLDDEIWHDELMMTLDTVASELYQNCFIEKKLDYCDALKAQVALLTSK